MLPFGMSTRQAGLDLHEQRLSHAISLVTDVPHTTLEIFHSSKGNLNGLSRTQLGIFLALAAKRGLILIEGHGSSPNGHEKNNKYRTLKE